MVKESNLKALRRMIAICVKDPTDREEAERCFAPCIVGTMDEDDWIQVAADLLKWMPGVVHGRHYGH